MVRSLFTLSAFLTCSLAVAQQADSFAGQYQDLKPEQKRLVDDWFQRFSQTIKKPVDPAEGYSRASLSERTTFSAITHALLTTQLTDETGKKLGPAIQIVDKVDRLAGKIPNGRGDEQFRMYVQLKPGTKELLAKSREFQQGPDNTVFHKGYPICFRSKPSAPSIQVSISRDERFADIDVDYRSSTFPVGLVNGHLTASNSDVRAGKNDEKHNQQWAGLSNWWRSLLGLPLADENQVGIDRGKALPKAPKVKGSAKPEEAVRDFLNSWLVEQQPGQALAYFDDAAYRCAEVERGRPVDRGMVKYEVLRGMQALNKTIGTPAELARVSSAVSLTGERVKNVAHPYRTEFALYDVREDLAERFQCVNKIEPERISAGALRSTKFGKYVGAVFQLKMPKGKGQTIAALWAKKDNFWKIVSYDLEPDVSSYRLPDLRAQTAAAALPYVEGDPELTKAAGQFLTDWFVNRDPAKAAQAIAPKCNACVNYYRPDETPAPKTAAQTRTLLVSGMRRLADAAPGKKLEEAIAALSPHHQDLKLVKHPQEQAFVIASIPDEMAAIGECSRRVRGQEIDVAGFKSASKGYGNFYAVGFSLADRKDDTGGLWTVWGKEGGAWKVVSFLLLAP
jgi:hypothetical protein